MLSAEGRTCEDAQSSSLDMSVVLRTTGKGGSAKNDISF
jgi:hypothetical protein